MMYNVTLWGLLQVLFPGTFSLQLDFWQQTLTMNAVTESNLLLMSSMHTSL